MSNPFNDNTPDHAFTLVNVLLTYRRGRERDVLMNACQFGRNTFETARRYAIQEMGVPIVHVPTRRTYDRWGRIATVRPAHYRIARTVGELTPALVTHEKYIETRMRTVKGLRTARLRG